MFGGSGGGVCGNPVKGGFCNDTWVFRDGDWHDVSHLSPAPEGRVLTSMAAYGDGAVLFGGYTLENPHVNDTWVWNPSTGWREMKNLAVVPPGRSYHTLAPFKGSVLLFGGTNRDSEAYDRAFGDTWIFNASGWTNLGLSNPNAPTPRWGHGLACNEDVILPRINDGQPGACVLTGGAYQSEDDHFQDTWMYTTAGWKQSQPGSSHPGPRPAGRWSFMMAPCGLGALMSTGSIGYRIEASDTWTFNFTHFPSPWTGPSPKGFFNRDAYGDWAEQAPAEHPCELGGAMLARVQVGNQRGVLLFGGVAMGKSGECDPHATWFWPERSCPGGSASVSKPLFV